MSLKYQGCNLDAERNIRMNFGHRRKIVCLLHKLAEGIWQCKQDQINTDPKRNWYRPVRKYVNQHTVHGSECTAGPRDDKKCEDWKVS